VGIFNRGTRRSLNDLLEKLYELPTGIVFCIGYCPYYEQYHYYEW
jgi:hypothetical protein